MSKNLRSIFTDIMTSEKALLVMACLVGLLAGLGAKVFSELILFIKGLLFDGENMKDILLSHWYILALIPMFGGLVVGPFSYLFPTEAKGHGVPEVMASVALDNGILKPRTIFVRALASAVCIGSGGSAGREGPIVQIGAAMGSAIGQLFKLHGERVKVLLGCGAAGGIAATFNAPLAGVVFSMEIILGDFTANIVIPIILSSVIATATARVLGGNAPTFDVPEYYMVNYMELALYAVLGVVCGLVAYLFIKTLYWFEDFFEEKLNIPNILKPALGGLLIGIISCLLPNHEIMGNGYETIHSAINGEMLWTLAFMLIFLKIIGTSLTLGSGGSGGIFAPALFIGAMVGLSFGYLVNMIFPGLIAGPGAYALVGMGSVMAAAAHAPLTNIFILFELTNQYEIILPIMISCIIATAIAKHLSEDSIYTLKLSRRGIKLHRGREEHIMESIRVSDVMRYDIEALPENTPFREFVGIVSRSKNSYFPIVGEDGRMSGIVSFADIREVLFEEGLADLVVAKEFASAEVVYVTPSNNLHDAMEKFEAIDVAQLPVVDEKDPKKILAMLSRGDIIAAYNRAVLIRGLDREKP